MRQLPLMLLAATLLVPAMLSANEPLRGETMPHKKLTPEEERVIVEGGTERPFTGEFVDHHVDGTYTCRRCGAPLYRSTSKFESGCGWPSFDEAEPGAVQELADPDGVRTEIRCAACGGHLGHVFRGEGFTEKNTRHCVNSISMGFEDANPEPSLEAAPEIETAYFAGGCFWGVEYHFESEPGVLDAVSGYMGGALESPSYEQVCYTDTGHAEAVRIRFDPKQTSYEKLARLFFEIHDPTQLDRQGPDVGTQYRSAIFTTTAEQRETAVALTRELKGLGFDVVTQLEDAGTFWEAESYHQDYYERKGSTPYCHARTSRFE